VLEGKKQVMRDTTHTLVQAQDVAVESVVRNDIASAMSNIDREKLASIIDDKIRVQRQCISPVYKHFRRNTGEFPMRVPDMTAFAAHAVYYGHNVHSMQDSVVGMGKLNMCEFVSHDNFGTRRSKRDIANARYLFSKPSTYGLHVHCESDLHVMEEF
jgi:hypothetical protein